MLIWGNHSCMPLRPEAGLMLQLDRYRSQGVDVVSLNVTFDLANTVEDIETQKSKRTHVGGFRYRGSQVHWQPTRLDRYLSRVGCALGFTDILQTRQNS